MKAVVLLLSLLQLGWAADAEEEAKAGIDHHAKAAYFVLASSGYVFALNVAENGDVYYHMNAPASHSWMGVGFGSSMINSRMLISYMAEDGHHLTNSCRMSRGHSEPEWESDMVIEGVYDDVYAPYSNTLSPDGIMITHAVCRNCSSWVGGQLDTTSTTQPLIFALGPNTTLRSDDPAAELRLHEFHGTFQLDMTVATNRSGSYGRVPAPQDPGLQVGDAFWAFANYFSSQVYHTGTDAEWAPVAHAVFMCIAFLLVFPLGVLSLRLLRRAMIHAVVQGVGLGFVLLGSGLGIYASRMYNKSHGFHSTHQIIGLLVVGALFLQIGLGLSHHLIFLRSGSPTILGKVHRILGISLLVLGLVNGGIGLNFAGRSTIPYSIVVALMAVLFGAAATAIFVYHRQHIYQPERSGSDSKEYGLDPPSEYEMHRAPLASMGQTGYVQTPRTPFFGLPRYYDDPEDYRAYEARGQTKEMYGCTDTDTAPPGSDKDPTAAP